MKYCMSEPEAATYPTRGTRQKGAASEEPAMCVFAAPLPQGVVA